MSGLGQAVRDNFRNLWRHGDDDDYAEDEDETDTPITPSSKPGTTYSPSQSYSPPVPRNPAPVHGGGGGSQGGSSGGSAQGARRLQAVPSPLRAREKNIYTIKPKSQEDATMAADYLKTGDAVIVNLEEVDRMNAVRIIDFMSGVCYGLDGPGHAMKLGEAIFLYTPAEFEIRSDEVDYSENQDLFFKDVPAAGQSSAGVSAMGYTNPATPPTTQPHPAPAPSPSSQGLSADPRRAWER